MFKGHGSSFSILLLLLANPVIYSTPYIYFSISGHAVYKARVYTSCVEMRTGYEMTTDHQSEKNVGALSHTTVCLL